MDAIFRPTSAESGSHPFFQAGDADAGFPPLSVPRTIDDLPSEVAALLRHYPPSTRFTDGKQWTLMSEDEIRERYRELVEHGQTRVMDLMFAYAGMGHLRVLSCDPMTGRYFETWDGGSNGYDREANFRQRVRMEVPSSASTWEEWARTMDEPRNN